jgi:hypothetical protein
MRPIVNLGRSSHVSLPAAPAPRAAAAAQQQPGGARQRARRPRRPRVRLSFRPVNFHLQNVHKARAPLPSP